MLAARHLSRGGGGGRSSSVRGGGGVSPFVEVEVSGAPYDCARFRTKTVSDNGLCPVWDEVFNFRVLCPELALLR